jgi:hypothetical protein
MGYVVAPESSQVGRQDPEPWDLWQCRSPPKQGGRIQSHGTQGGTRAIPSREAGPQPRDTWQHRSPPAGQGSEPWDTWKRQSPPNWEAGSRDAGHMATPEPSRVERWNPEPLDTWWRWSPPWLEGRVWYYRSVACGCTPRSLS